MVERLGKLYEIREPGIFFAIPLIDRIAAVHDMREVCIRVPTQTATTQDNVRISLEGNVYVRIVDVEKATYKIRRPLYAVLRHAEAAMRASVGLMELDNIFHSRATLNAYTLEHLQEACSAWGLSVTRYEVTGVDADAKIAEAMDLQAAAERRRRETVKTAMAEKEAVVLESEGQMLKDKNEAEGKKIRAITEAEGFMEEARLRAEGMKRARELEAEGTAYALQRIGQAAQTEEGQRALQYLFGKEYVSYMAALGSKSTSTVFLGQDVGDISSVLAKGMGVFQAMNPNSKTKSTADNAPPVAKEMPDFRNFDYNEAQGGKYADEINELQNELNQYGNIAEKKY